MPCFLGIDYGTKRIGLAVSDSDASIASPLAVIDARGNLAERARAVVAAAREYEVDAFVVGLPKNMDGTEGRQAKITRNFADELARTGSKPVQFWDERLSSFTAQELLQPARLSRKKKKAVEDSIAAQVILQNFLDARGK